MDLFVSNCLERADLVHRKSAIVTAHVLESCIP